MHCEDVVLLFSHCSVLFITRVWNQQKVNIGPVDFILHCLLRMSQRMCNQQCTIYMSLKRQYKYNTMFLTEIICQES